MSNLGVTSRTNCYKCVQCRAGHNPPRWGFAWEMLFQCRICPAGSDRALWRWRPCVYIVGFYYVTPEDKPYLGCLRWTRNMADAPHPLPSPWKMADACLMPLTSSHHLKHGSRPSPLPSPWTWLMPLIPSHHLEHCWRPSPLPSPWTWLIPLTPSHHL